MSNKIIQLKKNGDNLFPQTSQYRYASLPLDLVFGTLTPSDGHITLSSSTATAVTRCTIAVPYVGVTLQFSMPADVTATVYTNDAA